jgi:hypothetical protein
MDFGAALTAAMDSRGVGVRELARRVPCDAGYVSQLRHGRKQPSPELAARLDELLGADGALAALGGDEPPSPGISAGRLALATARGDLAATTDLIRRLRASDVDTATLEALAGTTDTLCMQYAYRRPAELRSETQQWLSYVSKLLGERVGLREHRELLVTAGWLTLLTGCLEYDSGMAAAAEATRISAFHLGREAGHAEIVAWSMEMAAWFAHTRHDLKATVTYARAGQEAARGASVAVQLVAHEARALGRMGDKRAVGEALERGHNLLQRLPLAGNPLNHFVVDPAKFDFYAMDCYRVVGDDVRAAEHAHEVLRAARGPDGKDLAPMRMAEARVALGVVSARAGDLEQAADYGAQAFRADRKCLPSLLLVAGELDTEIRQRYPGEQPAREFHEQLTDLRRTAQRVRSN